MQEACEEAGGGAIVGAGSARPDGQERGERKGPSQRPRHHPGVYQMGEV